MEEIVNKVQQQDKLITLDLEKYHDDTPIVSFDLKEFLFQGLLLKEMEFRKALKQHDWSQYEGVYLSVHCSTDAIVAKWAYMLVAAHARDHAKEVFFGSQEDVRKECYLRRLKAVDWAGFANKFVVLKGCSNHPVPESIYLHATKQLLPHVQKLMYGEACSSVPVYNRPRR